MPRSLVGIAGGSGSGKSALAVALCREYPQNFALVHVDDYFKKPEEVPPAPIGGPNWDHPHAVRFEGLYWDLRALLDGKPVVVQTKSELYHPAYDPKLKNRIPYTIEPKPVVLLEGYLALYDPRIWTMMALSIYLDIPITESLRRRSPNKSAIGEAYLQQVLLPAHEQFVEPTKKNASVVLNISTRTKRDVLQDVGVILKGKKLF